MAYIITDKQHYTDIASAIRTKSGAADEYTPAQMAAAIAAIPSGGGGGGSAASLKDINFYDYDGTLLHSYWLSDLPLTALPAAPDHSSDEVPLTFQQWTHTLAQVNACTDKLDVGATLIPTDGKTHLIINIAAEGRMTVPLCIYQSVANGVSIDWGDGSTPQTLAGTGYVNTTHTYAETGRYDITLTVADGCTLDFGNGTSSYCVLGSTSNNGTVYCNMLQEVYIGSSVTSIGTYAFSSCYSLASIVIPPSVTSIGTYAFSYYYSLASIVIPPSVTSISDYTFYSCGSLASIVIPPSVTSIGNYAFYSCPSLASMVIPQGVTSIGTYAFRDCPSLASMVIPQGVTSIGTYAFRDCHSLASIVIPPSVTSISDYTFYSCYSLASIVIPPSVTSIGNYAFYSCYGMAIYDFSACISVPTLVAKTNTFSGIPSDCIMKIPSALYTEWSTATNWSTYASKMVAV